MPLNDDALIRRALTSNGEQAFAELVRRYQSKLRYSLRQLTGYDESLADDLAQETFIKAYQKLHQFRSDSAFFTWLYRIAWRCFADHYRKHKPEQALRAAAGPEQSYTPQDRNDLHLDFAMALMNFDPDQRMALHLHLHRGFSHREISQIMDCPLGTIKSHIQRGRPILQRYLEAWQK